MGLDSQNPLYSAHVEDWRTMRDLYRGERVVKAAGETYLPATAGMRLDGMQAGQEGRAAYDAYKLRAVFHDYVREGVEALVGLLHQKAPSIELPAVMEPLRERATITGESLELLLRRINEEQLIPGRLGLLADLPLSPDPTNPLPYVAIYVAESIHNWDDGTYVEGFNALNMVVLNESGFVRTDDFTWTMQEKYRVLQLGQLLENEAEGTAVYQQGVFETNGYTPAAMTVPLLRGAPLEQIPFVFINSKDIVAVPDEPPLMGLGRLTLAIYRGEADYRQNLYMQGQDTLVTIGGMRASNGTPGESDEAVRTGAGSRIDLEMGGDAKYIGVGSQGLSEQREALENDKKRAEVKAAQLVNGQGSNAESGEALRTRLAAQTATLNQIALTGAAGLERVLRIIATWMGANPEEVKVTPNIEFADFELSGQEIVYLMTARSMGAPLSKQSIHGLMVERGITKLDFDAEMDVISEEDANSPALGTGAGGDPALPKPGDE
jgi:hypothetical protein